MNDAELSEVLKQLLRTGENEVVEFKQATNNYSTSKIGEYFSAMSNEANLRESDRAWLIFGVNNETRNVVGSNYRVEPERLQSLKQQIAADTEPSMTFREIHVLWYAERRVVLFEIPAAPAGIPIAWKGHYYARAGDSLGNLGLDKLDAIRNQTLMADWSSQIVPGAKMEHLDGEAIIQARESFAMKHSNRFPVNEVMEWPLETFLDRARLTRDRHLTRAVLLLLGKKEAAHLLLPHPAQITWKLEGPERAYEHFGPPFLLSTSYLYQKIRNIQFRVLPDDMLFAIEMSKYDKKVVLEALHNCIAHQDYSRNARIVVTERSDRLVFENEGNFFEGHPDDYISGVITPRRYRNPFLVQAMTELNMIDMMGYGIHQMHMSQASRFFPMPDYDLRESGLVRMTVYGSIVDPAYTRLLMQKTNLPLMDIVALDRVQKHLPLDNATTARLRRRGLIEGRKPNLHVSALVAKTSGDEVQYIRTRAQDDAFYEKLVTDYLKKFGRASRKEIDELLWSKLSDALNDDQKSHKISNLITKWRRAGLIVNFGSRKIPEWRLAE